MATYNVPDGNHSGEEMFLILAKQGATLAETSQILKSAGLDDKSVAQARENYLKSLTLSSDVKIQTPTAIDCIVLRYIGEEPFLIRSIRSGGFYLNKNELVILPDNAFGRAYAHKSKIFEVVSK